jgi:hypothetical protein
MVTSSSFRTQPILPRESILSLSSLPFASFCRCVLNSAAVCCSHLLNSVATTLTCPPHRRRWASRACGRTLQTAKPISPPSHCLSFDHFAVIVESLRFCAPGLADLSLQVIYSLDTPQSNTVRWTRVLPHRASELAAAAPAGSMTLSILNKLVQILHGEVAWSSTRHRKRVLQAPAHFTKGESSVAGFCAAALAAAAAFF